MSQENSDFDYNKPMDISPDPSFEVNKKVYEELKTAQQKPNLQKDKPPQNQGISGPRIFVTALCTLFLVIFLGNSLRLGLVLNVVLNTLFLGCFIASIKKSEALQLGAFLVAGLFCFTAILPARSDQILIITDDNGNAIAHRTIVGAETWIAQIPPFRMDIARYDVQTHLYVPSDSERIRHYEKTNHRLNIYRNYDQKKNFWLAVKYNLAVKQETAYRVHANKIAMNNYSNEIEGKIEIGIYQWLEKRIAGEIYSYHDLALFLAQNVSNDLYYIENVEIN